MTRSLLELYTILLDKYTKKQTKIGICGTITSLYWNNIITSNEYDLLFDHFQSVPRPKRTLFNIFDLVTPKDQFYWKENYQYPRIKFIKKIIKSLQIEKLILS